MHAYLLGRLGASKAELAALPTHNAMDSIADAMGAAVVEYCTAAGCGAGEAVMMMVVQPGERNAYDQQWLQTRLWERHGVRTLRRSLAQVRVWLAYEGRLVPRVMGCRSWICVCHAYAVCQPACQPACLSVVAGVTSLCQPTPSLTVPVPPRPLQFQPSSILNPFPSFLICSLRRRVCLGLTAA